MLGRYNAIVRTHQVFILYQNEKKRNKKKRSPIFGTPILLK